MRRALALAALGALLVAGCTGSPQTAPPPTPPSPSPSTPAPVETPPSEDWSSWGAGGPVPVPTGGPALRVEPQARVGLPDGLHVASLALSADRLAWTGCRPCAGAARHATDVYVADLPRGRPRVVARTAFRWGSTAVVGLSGQVVVWYDAADVRDGAATRTYWALRALDLRSGRRWTIDEGGRGDEPPRTPVAFVSAGAVHWQMFDLVTARGPVTTADLRTRAVRSRVADLPGRLRGVTSRGLVFTATDTTVGTVVADAPVPVDAYLMPASGGPPVPVTTRHDVQAAAATDDRVLWTTRPGDSETLWSLPVRGGAPARLVRGPVLAFAAGRGFAAWTTRETEAVVQVGAGGRVATLPDVPADGSVLAVAGDRLAILTVAARGAPGPVTVVVARVTALR